MDSSELRFRASTNASASSDPSIGGPASPRSERTASVFGVNNINNNNNLNENAADNESNGNMYRPAELGNLFRSEQMSLIQLYIPSEIARDTLFALGELGAIQFRDLNRGVNAFQRTFVNELRRLDEMERKLRFFHAQAEKHGIHIDHLSYEPKGAYGRAPCSIGELDTLEAKIAETERRILDMNASQETLNRRFLELTEMRHVLRESAYFFEQVEGRQSAISESLDTSASVAADPHFLDNEVESGAHHSRSNNAQSSSSLGFVAGILPRRRMAAFERVLWRSLRGNLYLDYAEVEERITDPQTDEKIAKNVFIIFAHGKELLAKIRKICESLGATLYPVDQSAEKRRADSVQISSRIDDLSRILENTNLAKRVELQKVALEVNEWEITVRKEKGVYYSLNMFNHDAARKTLIAEGWAPTSMITSIQYALHSATERTGSMMPSILNELRTTKKPPTFHRTNKFTAGFQAIIDSYGIAKYREVNPGLFTVITFPFLFAMMFGDVGHGCLMALAAGYMVWKERELSKPGKGEIFDMMFAGRYLILLMGLFSIYTGLIYNDLFSKSFYLRGSQFSFSLSPSGESYISKAVRSVYPIGVDPAWNGASNALLFINSYKMKQAVLFGVTHMMLGICLQVFNFKFFNQDFSIYVEFIPQALFMLSIFGYLGTMIICKWLVAWNGDSGRAPGLLNTLIFMFLSPGSVDEATQFYRGQPFVQGLLVLIALACVPVMLFGKPYILKRRHKQREALGYGIVQDHSPRLDRDNDNTRSSSPANGRTRRSNGVETPGRATSGDSHGAAGIDDTDHKEHGAHHTGGAGAEEGDGAAAAVHEDDEEEDDGHGGHGGHFDFGEIMVHQAIHTIEFCLGCISNTASYLRLWALSLAHAQLSEVLWGMIIVKSLEMNSILGPFIGFAAWFVLTVSILLVMEGLSAFLHALRLHWVEFNGKFYDGKGRQFEPFHFATIINNKEE